MFSSSLDSSYGMNDKYAEVFWSVLGENTGDLSVFETFKVLVLVPLFGI